MESGKLLKSLSKQKTCQSGCFCNTYIKAYAVLSKYGFHFQQALIPKTDIGSNFFPIWLLSSFSLRICCIFTVSFCIYFFNVLRFHLGFICLPLRINVYLFISMSFHIWTILDLFLSSSVNTLKCLKVESLLVL